PLPIKNDSALRVGSFLFLIEKAKGLEWAEVKPHFFPAIRRPYPVGHLFLCRSSSYDFIDYELKRFLIYDILILTTKTKTCRF
ncbi:MAG: hypothetical protein Q4F18_09975, partial [Clostridia bacterium]|nr:hypothetical protein [Clostridia bacterium]